MCSHKSCIERCNWGNAKSFKIIYWALKFPFFNPFLQCISRLTIHSPTRISHSLKFILHIRDDIGISIWLHWRKRIVENKSKCIFIQCCEGCKMHIGKKLKSPATAYSNFLLHFQSPFDEVQCNIVSCEGTQFEGKWHQIVIKVSPHILTSSCGFTFNLFLETKMKYLD